MEVSSGRRRCVLVVLVMCLELGPRVAGATFSELPLMPPVGRVQWSSLGGPSASVQEQEKHFSRVRANFLGDQMSWISFSSRATEHHGHARYRVVHEYRSRSKIPLRTRGIPSCELRRNLEHRHLHLRGNPSCVQIVPVSDLTGRPTPGSEQQPISSSSAGSV